MTQRKSNPGRRVQLTAKSRLRLLQSVRRWGKIWGVGGLDKKVSISVSPRLNYCLARCSPAAGVIRLSIRILTPRLARRYLDEAVCHEAAHIAASLLRAGDKRPHGPIWQALMRSAGFEPRARLALPCRDKTSPQRRAPCSYIHSCPVCHRQWRARRCMKNWRCADCVAAGLPGQLVIHRLTRGPA